MKYTKEYLKQFVDDGNWDVQDYLDRLTEYDTIELDQVSTKRMIACIMEDVYILLLERMFAKKAGIHRKEVCIHKNRYGSYNIQYRNIITRIQMIKLKRGKYVCIMPKNFLKNPGYISKLKNKI